MENFSFSPASPGYPILEKEKSKQETIKENFSQLLEACSKNNKEIHVIEDAISAPVGKLSELYDKVEKKYKAMLGILLFVASSHIGFDSAQTEKEAPIQEDSFEQTTEKREAMKKIAGFDVAQEAEKVGRHAKFYSPKTPTKFTIIHLGQMHEFSQEANYEYRNKIEESQTKISAFLTSATSAGASVFIEGYPSDLADYTTRMRDISARITSAQNFKNIEQEYHKAISENYDERSTALINKVTGDKLISLGFREVAPMEYSDGPHTIALVETGYLPKDKAYSVSNDTESAIAGAAYVLNSYGQINIENAETIEGRQHVFDPLEILRLKGKIIGKFFNPQDSSNFYREDAINQVFSDPYIGGIGEYASGYVKSLAQSESCKRNMECQKITKEIIEVDIPEIKKAIYDDREDIAVELIAKQAKTSTQNVFPLVYGSAHDFTRAILKWNKAHPEEQFNLVTVK